MTWFAGEVLLAKSTCCVDDPPVDPVLLSAVLCLFLSTLSMSFLAFGLTFENASTVLF